MGRRKFCAHTVLAQPARQRHPLLQPVMRDGVFQRRANFAVSHENKPDIVVLTGGEGFDQDHLALLLREPADGYQPRRSLR